MRKFLAAVSSLTRKKDQPFPGRPSDGTALAVIGDVHGYADHFARMMDAIDERCAELSPDRSVVVQVGDLIDRGPDSARCLDIAAEQKARGDIDFTVLMGNHEVFLKTCLNSDDDCIKYAPDWLTFGGRETMDSLMLDGPCPPLSAVVDNPGLFRMEMRAGLEGKRRALIDDLDIYHLDGSVLIAHAGFTGNIPVDQAIELPWDGVSADHWAWTRTPSMEPVEFQGMQCGIVHGHSIHAEARPIGARFPVDTGVYRTGRLSAVIFFGDEFEVVEITGDV